MASKQKPDFTNSVSGKAADAVFGAPAAPPEPPTSPNLIARPVSVFEIWPDPKQPRRLLPGSLRYDRPIEDILADWYAMANDEARRTIPVVEMLKGDATTRGEEGSLDYQARPIEAGFMDLIDLAITIRRDGLRNPITIYKSGTVFQIETGERRWLAHHLLGYVLDEPEWTKISAREIKEPSVWAQANENTARAPLNAISLARQLALLVMDIYQHKGMEFIPYQDFQHDRHFYAQVADGNLFPVEHGDRERIAAAMGKSNASQVNQYRALLRLPDDVWQVADQQNKGEKPLREVLQNMRQQESVELEADPEPITGVISHSSIQAQESEAPEISTPEDNQADSNTPQKLPDSTIARLDWAYRRAAAALSDDEWWFSADNATSTPDRLNELLSQGLLEGRRQIANANYSAAFYRISNQGCEALGQPILSHEYGTPVTHLPPGAHQPGFSGGGTKPRSASEALGGNGKSAGTPPRRSPKHLLQGADRNMVQTALQAMDGRLGEIDGVREAISTLERSMAAHKRRLTELYTQRDKLERD